MARCGRTFEAESTCCYHERLEGWYSHRKEDFLQAGAAGFSLSDSCDLQAAPLWRREVDRTGEEAGCR